MFSARSEFEQRTNPWTLRAEALRAQKQPLIDLTSTNPTTVGLCDLHQQTTQRWQQAIDGHYEPIATGHLQARDAIAALYAERGEHCDPTDVLITASTSEAYAHLFRLLCNPGDNILVPAPSYPLLGPLAQLENVAIKHYALHFADGWHIDTEHVRTQCDARTRAIVMISPNNPTGSYVKRHEAHALAKLNIPIISDEVFRDFAIDNIAYHERAGASDFGDTLCFTLDGLSKTLALPQAKLGWIWARGHHKADARERLEHINDTFLSAQTSIQTALPDLLKLRTSVQNRLLERLKANVLLITEHLKQTSATPLPLEGGWSLIIRMPNTKTDEAWALECLDHGVLAHPGYFYDLGGSHLVVSILTPEPIMTAGLDVLKALLT